MNGTNGASLGPVQFDTCSGLGFAGSARLQHVHANPKNNHLILLFDVIEHIWGRDSSHHELRQPLRWQTPDIAGVPGAWNN
jgi:hypothetical protein